MTRNGALDEPANDALLADIANRYFIDKETQDSIGRSLNLSRMKVNRLLKQAQDAGIVEIRVRFHSSETREIEKKLCDKFGLQQVLIAPDSQLVDQQRTNVATLVSRFLETNLRENVVVAVGMGRNVARVAAVHTNRKLHSITFVAGSGGATEAGETGNADHICRNLARSFGGSSETLYAPAYVPDAQLRERLLRHETVRRTLNLARSAQFALIGVGDLGPDSHMVRMGWFSQEEMKRAKAAGVVGDLMGYDFIDRDGNPQNMELGGRVIGLTRNDLRQIDRTIAIASEPSKAAAILGSLRTGAIDILATSLSNCLAILDMVDEQSR